MRRRYVSGWLFSMGCNPTLVKATDDMNICVVIDFHVSLVWSKPCWSCLGRASARAIRAAASCGKKSAGGLPASVTVTSSKNANPARLSGSAFAGSLNHS